MRRLLLTLCAVLLMPVSQAAAPPQPFELKGEWEQGGVVIGKAQPATQVWFNGRLLRLSPQGEFIFGLDRDEKASVRLEVQAPGQAGRRAYRYAVAKRQYKIQTINGLPPGMVTPPPEALERIREDQRRAREARERDSELAGFAVPFIWPAVGNIVGVFGSQRILNGVPKQPHYGVDVAVPIGTPIKAPADGVVSLAEADMYYTGGTIMLDHGHGLTSAFLHLSKLLVKVGDTVRQGQVIAESGMTGRATGPHLDWRVSWFDAHVDAQLLAPPMPAQELSAQP